MSSELLASVAGILLSLIASYVPGVNAWYEAQTTATKRLTMLGALVVVSAGAYGLSCAGWFSLPVTCDKTGAEELITAFILALVANQGTYLISKG